MLYISHDVRKVLYLSDNVIVMSGRYWRSHARLISRPAVESGRNTLSFARRGGDQDRHVGGHRGGKVTPLLSARDAVDLRFGHLGRGATVRALSRVDIDVFPGEVVAVIGESVVGKPLVSNHAWFV